MLDQSTETVLVGYNQHGLAGILQQARSGRANRAGLVLWYPASIRWLANSSGEDDA